jgi:hypothetical protein
VASSQNGWSADPNLTRRPLVVDGVEFVGGIRDDDDVATVLDYVLTQFHERVEPLRNPGCWGFSYRANANDGGVLSNHSSGTAVDANAPAHPNAVPTWRTFTVEQTVEVHRILLEVDSAVRWGGDYQRTADAMHFEINVDAATLHGVAERLRDELNAEDKAQLDRIEKKLDDLDKVLARITKAKREVIAAVEDEPGNKKPFDWGHRPHGD